jgi:hypothetical protein
VYLHNQIRKGVAAIAEQAPKIGAEYLTKTFLCCNKELSRNTHGNIIFFPKKVKMSTVAV